MLNCSRLATQISRVTGHTHHNLAKKLDVRSGFLRYCTKNKKPPGTTLTPEECLPPKSKSYKKVPPLPPPVPPPPGESLQPPQMTRVRPPCDDVSYTCPPDACSPAMREECHKAGGTGENGYGIVKYWKHFIVAIIVAGVSGYAYMEFFTENESKKRKMNSPKHQGRQKIVPNPHESKDIPGEIPYLLIGGGTAAFSAFRAIKASDPTAKVLVISNEGDYPYMRPPLSKELWYNRDEALASKLMFKQWNGSKRSLFYEPPEFYTPVKKLSDSEKGGVSVATGWKVKRIDISNKTAYLEDDYPIKYEKCLIATGASPKNLIPFEKADKKIKEKIIVFRTKDDYLELVENIKKTSCKNIVIIGGGFLGSELSTSLARNRVYKDQKVYQVYKEKNILAQVLPEYLSEWTTKHSETEGVNCIPNVEVHDCRMKNNQLELTLTSGETLLADQVVVAIGVQPNTELAKSSDLEVDSDQGGFLVNAELEARSNLWVAGDAACFYDVKLGRRRVEHHDHAVISGRLAGENMTGSRKPYLHQSMFWSDLGPEVGFEAIGIIDSSLETVGVFAKASDNDKPSATADFAAEGNRSTNENKAISENEEEKSISKMNPTDSKTSIVQEKSNESAQSKSKSIQDDFGKGIIFYIQDNNVVGIVLWNIFNRMSVARQLLSRGTSLDEISEVAKLFAIHED